MESIPQVPSQDPPPPLVDVVVMAVGLVEVVVGLHLGLVVIVVVAKLKEIKEEIKEEIENGRVAEEGWEAGVVKVVQLEAEEVQEEAGDRGDVREEAGLGKIRVGLEVIGAGEEIGLDSGEEAQGCGELETGDPTLMKVEVLEELTTSSCC